jgi:hypothetical protein
VLNGEPGNGYDISDSREHLSIHPISLSKCTLLTQIKWIFYLLLAKESGELMAYSQRVFAKGRKYAFTLIAIHSLLGKKTPASFQPLPLSSFPHPPLAKITGDECYLYVEVGT